MICKIKIDTLALKTTIGTYVWEQHIQQTVLVDLTLTVDITQAAATDDIQHALDYNALSTCLIDYAAEQPHKLIETLAVKLQAIILEKFPQILALDLTLHKPAALRNAKDVAVELHWDGK